MEGMQSNEERSAERQMDEYLKSIGFHRKKIAKDGSCLFRAVAEQVLHCQSLHTKVRAKCVEFLKHNRESYEAFIEGDFEDYLFKLQDPQQWVGEVEIHALAVMYKRDFEIFQEPGKSAVNITDNNFKDKVRLCFLNGNHYDSVYPIGHLKNTAICQSILFELLYDGVFKVDRGSLSVCQRSSRPHDQLIDDNMAACPSSDESDLDTREPLWVENGAHSTAPRHSNRGRGRGRLSERVKRSLNPTLLRNIEYDVWHKTKRAQQKLDYCIAAGMQFSAGDRCQVRLEGSGRSYNATVKEVPSDGGSVTVHIEELGRKQVPLWSLRPPCDENSWSTVVNRDRRVSQSNGHGDWEERGKGRGRGKHVPAFSSASGSAGLVQKQHSWPPQGPTEEQGGAKPTRKTASSVEPPFGLTEQQRLAKEEEQRNVALVEIQLRDEQSFPALGGLGDGGRKKGEKRRPQRNKTKSPVEDVRTPSPPTGERPKSSTPPPPAESTTNAAASAPKPPPAAAVASMTSDSTSSSVPKTNTAASSALSGSTVKPNAAKAKPTSPPLPAAVPSSASLFSFITPVLPAASSPVAPLPSSSSSPPPASPSPPTFIAPIAPSPAAAQISLQPSSLTRSSSPLTALPPSPSPPSASSWSQPAPPASATESSPQPEETPPVAHTLTNETPQPQISAPPPQTQISLSQNQMPRTPASSSNPQQQPEETNIPPKTPQPHPEEAQSSHPVPSQTSDPVTHPPPSPPPDPPSQLPPESPPQPPPQQPHPSHPPYTSSIPGGVPVQQLSQLYQDPLYPGFPQGEKGEVVQPPPISFSRTGDDLPQDVKILRFFFNLGVKAYTVPLMPPYVYLLPLQQAHTMQPRIPSRSPSPTPQCPPSNPPPQPQEANPYPPYPPTSASMPPQYDHQQPTNHSDATFSQPGYPLAQPPRMPPPWQQHQMPPPRNFPLGYPTQSPAYPIPPPISQGYLPGQSSGHPLYPSSMSPYPPSSLGYQPSTSSEELRMSQGPVEQHPSPNPNGHIMPGQPPHQAPGLLGSPPGANANISVVIPGFAHKKEHGESLTRAVLLREPLINNNPMMVSNPGDIPITMTDMKHHSLCGSPVPYDISSTTSATTNPSYGYRSYTKPLNPTNTYVPMGAPEHTQVDYLANVAMAGSLSGGCNVEEDWDEQPGFKPTQYRGRGKYQRGGRGRGGYDSGRGGYRKRYGADGGVGFNYVQFNASNRGRGRERGY